MGKPEASKANHIGPTFRFEHNRSERAQQAEVLVPALANPAVRRDLFLRLESGDGDPIDAEEAMAAVPMHFVWVLRDAFSWERDRAGETRAWTALVQRWAAILDLPAWAAAIDWWRHPDGGYLGDDHYVVHPCNRTIGWTQPGIESRIKTFGRSEAVEDVLRPLVEARQVMNTESDCFVQTPARLIIIECKDKTAFSTEQRARQKRLGECLGRLFPRPNPQVFVEVARTSGSRPNVWTWGDLEARVLD